MRVGVYKQSGCGPRWMCHTMPIDIADCVLYSKLPHSSLWVNRRCLGVGLEVLRIEDSREDSSNEKVFESDYFNARRGLNHWR